MKTPSVLLLSILLLAHSARAEKPAPPPPENTTPATWCRYVPERMDDFAWENDLIAFRAYGPALGAHGGGEDSGVDVWLKRVKYPIIDRWYALEKQGYPYHEDRGEGNDPYHTGPSRGCGGTALLKEGEMVLPGTYKEWKIESREPRQSVFTLTYDYHLGGETIREVKRVTIGLGDRLFRSESTFTKDGRPVPGLEVAIGVTTHGGKAKATFDKVRGWMSCWETIEGKGLGTGVVIAPEAVVDMKQHRSPNKDDHAMLVTRTDAQGRTVHYAGYGWEGAGEITSPGQWHDYLTKFAANLKK